MEKYNKNNQLIRLDWAMKYMLRDKANFVILEGFLSALLKENITIIEILESESNAKNDTLKYNRVDMLVKDSLNRKFIIEVQNEKESNYLERLLFGTSKIITEYLKIGDQYNKVSKVISIGILYFNVPYADDYLYYGTTDIKGIHSGNRIAFKHPVIKNIENNATDIFPEYYIIDLPKFADEIKDDIDEWVYIFKNNVSLTEFKSKNIKEAIERLHFINMENDKQKEYEDFLLNLASEEDVIETAKKDGESIGIAKGKIEMAKAMLSEGLPIDLIVRVSGINIKEIEQLIC